MTGFVLPRSHPRNLPFLHYVCHCPGVAHQDALCSSSQLAGVGCDLTPGLLVHSLSQIIHHRVVTLADRGSSAYAGPHVCVWESWGCWEAGERQKPTLSQSMLFVLCEKLLIQLAPKMPCSSILSFSFCIKLRNGPGRLF